MLIGSNLTPVRLLLGHSSSVPVQIARTRYAVNQAELNAKASDEAVLTDVRNAYEAVKTNEEVVELYQSGYLKQAQESRVISEFAYKQGAAALLDFLDAERSYRSTQLAYRQSLAAYILAMEQFRQGVAVRTLGFIWPSLGIDRYAEGYLGSDSWQGGSPPARSCCPVNRQSVNASKIAS